MCHLTRVRASSAYDHVIDIYTVSFIHVFRLSGRLLNDSSTVLIRYFVSRQLTFAVAGQVPFFAKAGHVIIVSPKLR